MRAQKKIQSLGAQIPNAETRAQNRKLIGIQVVILHDIRRNII